MLPTSFFLALGLSAGPVAAAINKPALWGDIWWMYDTFERLPQTKSSSRYWNLNDISDVCYKTALQEKVDPKRMRSYSVTLGDCDQDWYICIEDGNNINDIVAKFSRVPVRMRQWVNDFIVFNKGPSGVGGWASSDMYRFVLYGGSITTGHMIHESTHLTDFGRGFHSMTSSDQAWMDVINADSAVPDEYARTNPTEDLAELTQVIIYDRFTNGALQSQSGLPRIGRQLQKVSDQSDWNSAYGGGILNLANSGLRCTRRWKLSTPVWPDSGKPVYSRRASVDSWRRAENSTLYVEELPVSIMSEPIRTNCTLHRD